mmetsp:Transcript_28417/g.39933  ORF Transcript_28417/g.39933 Transcript_28417/m.39933 type:complete len:288 (-) Transcript_28417:150-1013(-)
MASLLDCLLRHCLPPQHEDSNDEDDGYHDDSGGGEGYDPPRPAAQRMARTFAQHVATVGSAARTPNRPATSRHDVEEIIIVDDNNNGDDAMDLHNVSRTSDCHHHQTNIPSSASEDDNDHHGETIQHPAKGLALFWTKLTGQNQSVQHSDTEYESVRDHDDDEEDGDHRKHEGRTLPQSSPSPLRTASKYNEINSIPSIQLEEVVLPGSDLQKEMAMRMSSFVGDVDTMEDECVICMEGFTKDNPRMPTLCGCGENKTYFHLPCLYQWIEKDKNCPSCRQRLRWEEF